MKIAIIGTGNLGKSIARGLHENKVFSSLFLTKRDIKGLSEFESQPNIYVTTDNCLAVKESDIIIFAVQPSQFESILKSVIPCLKPNKILISTITGFDIAKIEAITGSKITIIRAMPNTAIAVGKSMTCLSSNSSNLEELSKAQIIFNKLGHTLVIPETKMQAATVICASGIAFWMRLIRATTQAAIQLGFDASEAKELAMYTCEGAANLLINTNNHPEEEIDKVTTPKGCTIEGLNEMEHKGLSSSLIHGMVSSYNKINNIKSEQVEN